MTNQLTLLERLKSLMPYINEPKVMKKPKTSQVTKKIFKKNQVTKTDIIRSNNKHAKGIEQPEEIKNPIRI